MSSLIDSIKSSRYSLPFFSALLLIVSQPPLSIFPAAYLALVPLLLTLERDRPLQNVVAGLTTGVVAYTGLVYWVVVAMNTFGGISMPLAVFTLVLLVLYLALYVGAFALLVPYLERVFRVPFWAGAPLVWTLLEYARGKLLTGFPWSFLAHSQHNFLPVVQVVSVAGSYFLSFLIVSVNCLLVFAVRRTRPPLAFTAVTICLLGLSLGFGWTQLKTRDAGTLTAAIAQGNIPQDVKWTEGSKARTVRAYEALTLQGARGTDLVVWPETAMPFVFFGDASEGAVTLIPGTLGTNLLFGTISRDRQGRYYNSAHVFGRNSEYRGTYSKVHLVPFGEFTPLREYLPFMEALSVQIGDFFSGKGHDPILTDAGKLGILICYEGIFPSISNETVRQGADVLVNLTNDAWYGRSSAPYQHLAFYIFRAVETDRFVLRAAQTGISAVIDPRGRITERTGLFEEAVLKGRYSRRTGITPYVRYGDWFIALCAAVLFGLAGYGWIRRKSKSQIPSTKS
jgi:apolipoprotein N-acyltransferase